MWHQSEEGILFLFSNGREEEEAFFISVFIIIIILCNIRFSAAWARGGQSELVASPYYTIQPVHWLAYNYLLKYSLISLGDCNKDT